MKKSNLPPGYSRYCEWFNDFINPKLQKHCKEKYMRPKGGCERCRHRKVRWEGRGGQNT